MRQLSFAAAFFVAFVSGAFASGISTFRLANGLQAVVIEDHRAPVVVQMIWYKIGAGDERPGVSGIAHFLEHLMFKGTDKYASGEFSRVVEANGGSDNAFTSWDYTAYFQRVAADRLELMMKMEADRMRGLRLTPDDVKTERKVILEERSQRIDNNPGALFAEQRRAAQYLNSPYGIPVIGWRQEMEKLSRAEAIAFYHKYYAPNNAVLIVAGDVDPARVRAMAERQYGPIKPTPGLGVRARPQEPPQLAARHLTFSDPRVAQPYLIRTYLAPERNAGAQSKAAALSLLADLLGGNGITSVLGQKLQLGQKIALHVSASYNGTSLDPTTFGISVVPVKGVPLARVEAALDKALAEFLKTGVDPAQLARVKAQVKADQIYALDSVRGRAQRYGEALSTSLTVADVQAWPDVLQAVTAAQIMVAAREVLDPRRSVTGWLMKSAAGVSK